MRLRRAVRADRRRSCSSTSRPLRCAGRGIAGPGRRSGRRERSRRNRFEYHLDFPGNALDPGCDYERWAHQLAEGSDPRCTRTSRPTPASGEARAPVLVLLRLQRLEQPARGRLGDDPARLRRRATRAKRSPRSRSRSAIARTRAPSVPTGATSSSSSTARSPSCTRRPARMPTFHRALYLGSSAEQGSAATTPAARMSSSGPIVRTIPSDVGGASGIPVDRVRGPLGRAPAGVLQRSDGSEPEERSGPQPIAGRKGGEKRSYAVPTGGVFGTDATDFFCGAVARARGARPLLRNPTGCCCSRVLFAIVVFLVTRTRGGPSRRSARRRRAWGQILSAAGRMYVERALLFLGIGLAPHPARARDLARQGLVLGGFGLLGVDTTGRRPERSSARRSRSGRRSLCSGSRSCRRRPPARSSSSTRAERSARSRAYRIAIGGSAHSRELSPSPSACVAALAATAILVPVAVWLAVRWSLLAQVVELEERQALAHFGAARSSFAIAGFESLAGRCRRGAGACGRPVPGRLLIVADGHAARAAQHRRGSCVRARHAVRRAHDGVCLLRLESPERARARAGERRPACGDSADDVAGDLDAVLEPLRLGQAFELLQRVVLDLADALARDPERATHLLERARLRAVEPVAELDDAPLPLGQRARARAPRPRGEARETRCRTETPPSRPARSRRARSPRPRRSASRARSGAATSAGSRAPRRSWMSSSSAISSGSGSRPSRCTSCRSMCTTLFSFSTMCTGIRIVRALSAIARVTACRIHQVAYVENL